MSEVAKIRCAMIAIFICIGYTIAGAIMIHALIMFVPLAILAISILIALFTGFILDAWSGFKWYSYEVDAMICRLFKWIATVSLALYVAFIAAVVHGAFGEDDNASETASDTYQRLIREEDRKTHERTTQAPQQIRVILNRR